MTAKFKRRLKRTSIVLVALFFLIVRGFSKVVLGEPFFGETLTSWFDGEAKKDITNPQFGKDVLQYQHIIKSTTDTANFSDLSFLDTIVNQKQIVGMGEATHGSKEFFEMKQRMFTYLVTKHHYKIFAIEADFAATQQINDYVLNGIGDAKEALKNNGYSIWYTAELLNTIQWMRYYNSNKADSNKVQFLGYDMQQADASFAYIKKYLDKNFIILDSSLLFTNFKNILKNKSAKQIEKEQTMWLQNLDILKNNIILSNTKLNIKNTKDYKLCLQMINNIASYYKKLTIKDFGSAYQYRDSCMAANINWIKANSGNAKVMLWAHNAHIANDEWDATKAEPASKWMGKWLKEKYGTAYYNVGFVFNEGGVTARVSDTKSNTMLMFSFIKSMFGDVPFKINTATLSPYRKNHLSKALAASASPISYFNFPTMDSTCVLAKELNKNQNNFMIGAAIMSVQTSVMEQNYWKAFDGLIFINKVEGAQNFYKGTLGEYEQQ
jgi:erythromycin esterase